MSDPQINATTQRWVLVTFLLYTLAYETLVIGGCGYVVFVLHRNPWWWLLAVAMSASQIKTHSWHSLLTGVAPPKDE